MPFLVTVYHILEIVSLDILPYAATMSKSLVPPELALPEDGDAISWCIVALEVANPSGHTFKVSSQRKQQGNSHFFGGLYINQYDSTQTWERQVPLFCSPRDARKSEAPETSIFYPLISESEQAFASFKEGVSFTRQTRDAHTYLQAARDSKKRPSFFSPWRTLLV